MQYPKLIESLNNVKVKLSNHLIINLLLKHVGDIELINKYISYIDYLLNKAKAGKIEQDKVNDLDLLLSRILSYLQSENTIIKAKIYIVDEINKLFNFYPVTIDISRDEFSLRYDKLINLLNLPAQESNLILETKVKNKVFKVFKNRNESLVFISGEEKTDMSVSKDSLMQVAFEDKEPTYKSYEPLIIEKLIDNTIFNEIKDNSFIDNLKNSTTEGQRLKKLEENGDILFSQIKQLELKLDKVNNIDEIYEKAKVAEENFKNTEESILSKIETNTSKSFWENQVKFFDEKYKWYLWTTIITTVIFVILLAIYKYAYLSSIINTKSSDLGIKEIIAYGFIILLISLAIWIIRIFMKIALSSYHLSIDAKERVTMINTYIALMQEGNAINENDKRIMIESIFRQTNNGIIKDENSVTVTDVISSLKSK
ncbi:DUF6161 domain-containing protein [Arcobacter arenosus]|uniref:DUF6161 domain-containing protein n=1 Tax=Arcobacter arenosus TaxID=2576037 RepID=A0A5R8Y4T0_9BACT|nr:DUF6161 domain-containing protein [Arcobacter arenosus]TLP40673.1 hypothetical protein FDK22_01280 [Arcobacter arenosus]